MYVNGPSGNVATVMFRWYGADSSYAAAVSSEEYKTVESGTLTTFSYDASNTFGTTYYWTIIIDNPGEITPTEMFLSFTTVSS